MHETTSRESPITSSADSKSLVPIDSKVKEDKLIFILNCLSYILNYFFRKGLAVHVGTVSLESFVFTILIQRQKD